MKSGKIYVFVIVAISIICLLPFLYVCRYVHPVNDDYSFAMTHIGSNCFAAVVDSYFNWSGRYLATFLSSLNPLSYSVDSMFWYKVASTIMVLLFFFVPIVAFRVMAGKYLGKFRSAALGCLFFIMFMALCPKVSELFYWFSSYVAFTVPSLVALLFFAILPRGGRLFTALQCLLAFVIPGGNEVTAVLFVMTVLFLALVTRNRRIMLLAAIAVVAIVIVILSPGNGVRMGYQLSGHPYLWTVMVSVLQTLSWGVLWLPALLLVTMVYVPLVGVRLCGLKIFNIKPLHYVIFVTLSVLMAHIPATLGLSSVITGRTANSLLFFFILYYFFGVQIIINRHADALKKALAMKYCHRACAVMLFCFTFLCPLTLEGPVATAYFDIACGKAARYDAILTERDILAMENCENVDTVVWFKPLGITSKTLFVKDLGTVPDAMFCYDYSHYHKLKCKVAVDGDDIRFISNYETIFLMGKQVRNDK